MIARIMRERILSVPCETRSLPCVDRDKYRAENTLFGWVIHARREEVPCASEAEARYLIAFARMGYTEVPVPKDPARVAEVVSDVEKAVADITRQIEEKTSGELNSSRRSELVELVWEGIRDRIEEAAKPSPEPKAAGRTGQARKRKHVSPACP